MTLDEAIQHCEEVAVINENLVYEHERIEDYAGAGRCQMCAEEHRQLAEKLKELKELREQTEWIPCTPDTMPEEREWIGTEEFGTTISDEVYVTFKTPDGELFTKHLRFQNGQVPSYEQRTIDVFYKGSVPIAWKPLPKPYQPKEE